MRKNPKTWAERFFWPTELAYRFRHCYAPHGMMTLFPEPSKERPAKPNRRGPSSRKVKLLRSVPARRQLRDLDLLF